MAQLTLRTLLAYLDDTLEPGLTRQLGAKVAESELARDLIERIKKVTRRRGLQAPTAADGDVVSDPNTVAEYLNNTLDSEQVTQLEETCLHSDAHLAEVAACHQILTVILTEPVRVPPPARERMYKLVPRPASIPHRRPGKTLPVGGIAPADRDRTDPDDADATLLLGLGRYATGSVVNRLALAGAVGVLSVLLAVAVFMALPHHPSAPPETDRGATSFAGTPTPPDGSVPPAETPKTKEPVGDGGTAPAPKPKDPEPNPPAPTKPKEGGLELGKSIAPPRTDRTPVGRVESINQIVLTRAPGGGGWVRLDPAGQPGVTGQDQVLCLPGYKADVLLDSGVRVHLWGNLPELLPAPLLEARVRFHTPARKAEGKEDNFDADISLITGRIYIGTSRAAGGRVRVRVAGQVWDFTLPDDKAEVVVEVARVFEPGIPFAKIGGELPRVTAKAAVVRGTAGLTAPDRFKTFEKIAAPAALEWDSKTGTLTDPRPIDAGNGYYSRFLLVGSDQGKLVQKALNDMATRLTNPAGVRVMLAEILTEPFDPSRVMLVQVGVYAQTAIVAGKATEDELKPLIDLLIDETRPYARVATINALAAWLAQDPSHTAQLDQQLAPKVSREGEPELILRLLRGFVAPEKPDQADVERLIGFLNHPSVAVRELALWNLINFVDPTAVRTPGLLADVGFPAAPGYEKFVKAWKARIEEVRNRPPEKNPPEKGPPEKKK